MADARVVYSDVTGSTSLSGTLFQGQKFWVSLNVPQRARFRNDIEANGGTVVPVEKLADILIVDHVKKNNPPRSYSYQFVEKSIRKGKLEDLEGYRVGPAARQPRAAGDTTTRAKGFRNPFSLEDDQILWDHAKPVEESNGHWKGRLIYRELEDKYPQHTWQSWRDRYVKNLCHRPGRPGGPKPAEVAETNVGHETNTGRALHTSNQLDATQKLRTRAESSSPIADDIHSRESFSPYRDYGKFSAEDRAFLEENIESILDVKDEEKEESWNIFANDEAWCHHTGPEWLAYFENVVLPAYQAKQLQEKEAQPQTSPSETPIESDKRISRQPSSTASPDESPISERVEELNIDRTSTKRKRTFDEDNFAIPESKRAGLARANHGFNRGSDNAHREGKPQGSSIEQASEIGSREISQEARRAHASSESERFETAPQFPSAEALLIQNQRHGLFEELPYPPSPAPGSEGIEASDEDRDDDILAVEEWIQARLESGKADNIGQVVQALNCTSMDPDAADTILQHLVDHDEIPQGIKGVWTAKDDKDLKLGEQRGIKRLISKHGDELVNRRRTYFQMQESAGI